MALFTVLDLIALAGFVIAWVAYAILVEWTPHGRAQSQRAHERLPRDLDAAHARARQPHGRHADHGGAAERHRLLRVDLADRDRRRADAAALERRHDDAAPRCRSACRPRALLWEAKTVGLAVVLIYAFFKFAWSYRLYNYVAIMLGATPSVADKDTPRGAAPREPHRRLFTTAGRHFNHGQRAFFFALGYLGWYAGPIVFLVTTAAVVIVIWRRQFASDSLRAIADDAREPSNQDSPKITASRSIDLREHAAPVRHRDSMPTATRIHAANQARLSATPQTDAPSTIVVVATTSRRRVSRQRFWIAQRDPAQRPAPAESTHEQLPPERTSDTAQLACALLTTRRSNHTSSPKKDSDFPTKDSVATMQKDRTHATASSIHGRQLALASSVTPRDTDRETARTIGRSANRSRAPPIRAPPCRCAAGRRPASRKRPPRVLVAACTPIDRIGLDRKARLPEHADRPRHMIGGGHQQPALARLWRRHPLAEQRRFRRCCGTGPRADDAARREAQRSNSRNAASDSLPP